MSREQDLKQLQAKRDNNQNLLKETLERGYEIDAIMFLKLRLDMLVDVLVEKNLLDDIEFENLWEDLIQSILTMTLESDSTEADDNE